MKTMRLLVFLTIIALASQGCSITGTKMFGNKVLFSDNFSTDSKKWDQVSDSSGSTGYYNGAYRIVVNVNNQDIWSHPGNESFTDTRVEVNAVKNAGPDDNDFGIICRYVAASQFYYAVISSDGYYAIMKMTNTGSHPVGEDSMLESDKILKGPVTNHIRFDCIGSTLTLYINGSQIDQHTDTEYTAGNTGLLAGTFSTPGTDILFDNFFVYKP
jgi:hypothetical protein